MLNISKHEQSLDIVLKELEIDIVGPLFTFDTYKYIRVLVFDNFTLEALDIVSLLDAYYLIIHYYIIIIIQVLT